ncbi:MAG: exonuclease SbcCD subunit D [Methanomassiliicoccales archaeon]|nr:exonuclease SbcCD subunit D [Methanomassiliicoccales archaeon]NYT14590.1 exonuclease SbcCD subunit D [Methanomassiliicoccales archaeon]
MRIVHVSDTHLGYAAYRKVDEETGLNQREVDVYDAFKQFVDKVLELKPDAVLHSGDLFDSVRPTNRALTFTLDQLIRLTEAGIPVVVIAGNHSTPRLRETGSVMRIFDHIRDVHPVYCGRLEHIEIGDMIIHAMPHTEGDNLHHQLQLLKPSRQRKYDVAMLHGGIVGLGVFKMDEFNEQLINSSYLRPDFDYIALGHFHEYSVVMDNACYSGSTERFSFSEARQKKGFLEVDLEKRSRIFHELQTRPMLDLGPLDANKMDHSSLQKEIVDLLESRELQGKIVRLVVRNIPSSSYRALDFHHIEQLSSGAMHFERRFEMKQDGISVQWTSSKIDSLEHEFVTFLEHYPIENVDKNSLQEKGLQYLKRGVEGSD